MRPLRLEVEGFTAFREKQEVDFEGLDLFVITGPTGAGKSSLLDAMIFALFGQVPRTGKRGVSDLVSHGLVEARVKLEFSIDARRYRLARRLSRKYAQSATLERRGDDGEWRTEVEQGGVKAVNERILELVKLPFEAFCKAVVLPQGEFAKFLKGDRDERRKTLVDLLGLRHYERMGELARGRARELETRIAQTSEILDDQYGDVTEEALAGLRQLAEDANRRADALNKTLANAETLDEKRRQLALAGDALERRRQDITELRDELDGERQGCVESQDEELRLKTEHEAAQGELDRRDEEVVGALRLLEEATGKHGDLEHLAKVEAALKAVRQCDEERAQREADRHTAEGSLEALRKLHEDAEKAASGSVHKLDSALTAEEASRSALERARARAEEAATQRSVVERSIAERDTELRGAEASSQRVSQAKKEHAAAEGQLEVVEAKEEELSRVHAAAAIAAGCDVGDPCPVCGRTLEEHPRVEAATAEQLAEADAQLADARKASSDTRAELAAAGQARSEAEARVRAAEAEIAEILGQHAGLEEVVAAAHQAEVDHAAATEQQETALKALAAARESDGAAKRAETEAHTKLDSANRELKAAERAVEAVAARARESSAIVHAHFGEPIAANASEQLAEHRREVAGATAEYKRTMDVRDDARRARDKAAEALTEVKDRLATIDAMLARLRSRAEAASTALDSELAATGHGTVPPTLPTVSNLRDAHVGELVGWCDRASTQVEKATSTAVSVVEGLDEDLAQLKVQHELVRDDVPVVTLLREAESQAREARIARSGDAKQMSDRLDQRKKLETQTGEQGSQMELLKALAAELRANRFIAFILQETLDLLAVRASTELLRISSDRYSLVSEDGDFSVIDHANADERRSVNTLSGGETFLASLALALALSQHVGDLATEGMGAKLEAVFIDEGFGALDPDTLHEVIDALERLRESELVVGVITHVPALAQRIGVGLSVEKEDGSSAVRVAA